MIKKLTLCIIHQHPRVLLGMKKRGFGMGRWNGFGGKVEAGETIEDATRREVGEENEGVRLFGSSDTDRFGPWSNIRTAEQIRECIETLELLDKAIAEPAKS